MQERKNLSRTMRIDILQDVDTSKPVQRPTQPTQVPRDTKTADNIQSLSKVIGGKDFQQLFQSAYDATLLTRPDGTIVDANLRAVQFLGYPRERVTNLDVGQIIYSWGPELLLTVQSTLQSDRFVLLQAYCARSDRSLFPAEISITSLQVAEQPHLGFFIRDITVRKEAESKLRIGSNAIENAASGIAIVDAEGFLQFVNRSMVQLWQMENQDGLLEKSLAELLTDPETLPAILTATQNGGRWSREVEARRSNGSTFFALISAAPNTDEEDQFIGVVLSVEDVTERKLADEKLHKTLEDLAKSNASLEQFAYVVSHDLQEPLRKVSQFGELLKKHLGSKITEEAGGYVERMQDAAHRMRDLINGILELSRISTRARGFISVDLASIARDVLSDLEVRIMQTQGTVNIGELPPVEAEKIQMRQLLQNLIGNALKFHREGIPPVVTVQTRIVAQDDHALPIDGHVCELVIEDNGIGFDPSQSERIFGIFQRLHRRGEYEGTGIGLAVCRKIVERHNGTISAESQPGEGTRFVICLPLHQPHPDAG